MTISAQLSTIHPSVNGPFGPFGPQKVAYTALVGSDSSATTSGDTEDSPEEVQNTPNVQEQPTNRHVPDPRASEWRKQNTWFGHSSHEPETAFALGLHRHITEVERISPDSDEYYEKINSRMQEKFPELFEETNEREVSTPKQKASNVVAPATRSTAPKKIRLTQTQVALSKRLGLTPAQYAKQLALDMRNDNG